MVETKTKVTAENVAEVMANHYGNDAEAIAGAYLELGITASDDVDDIANEIDEAYAGKHESVEAFARSVSDELGAVEFDVQWPHTCIDWKWAGRELMYDYSEQDGFYFRSL